ncbi:DUF3179 domain-containing protein [Candidatus Saccharibacteria bacterium]|nr:DUF3179 domain-containing protein [Candidatus Saccharibacteria bacterium]
MANKGIVARVQSIKVWLRRRPKLSLLLLVLAISLPVVFFSVFNKPVDEDNIATRQSGEIVISDGVKHSIPLDEVIDGGPAKDGIPPIDNPKFIPSGKADFITDDEPGIAISIDGVNRFYPYQILVWHEIVNDRINGKKVLVTYCPLCLSGIVFDPVVDGERVEFGTSGKLWQSNLLMYDRKTESLWSQILGEAVVGERTGDKLNIIPSDIVKFGKWRQLHPDGAVLSRDTGFSRSYGVDPYGDYYTSDGTLFGIKNKDSRLGEKEFVLGLLIGGKAKAFRVESVKKVGRLEDNFAGKQILVEYQQDVDTVRLFEKTPDGSLVRLNPFPAFWFSWAAAHPDTELYK